MNTCRNSQVLLLALCALAVAPARAQNPPAALETAEIDKIFSWAMADCPGCTVAASLNGVLVVNRAYGSADLKRNLPITPDTIFDAGSLMKQFAAAAALLLVDEGKLSLADDIRKYIPELPDYGHTIKIDHLLTHTSGIRDWNGIMPLAAGEDDAWTIILRQRGLNFAPGEEWGYSNSGFVLAREIVARASGMSFADFTRTRLFEPLGMKSTAFCSDINGVLGNRALAYDKDGDNWKPAMMLGRERGGGGIFSTAADLVIWNDALTNNRLGAFVSETLQVPATLNNGRKLDYAHGLILGTYRGAEEVWHTGSAEGYKSFLGCYPEHGLSIAIMCNSGDGTDRTAFAHRIFDLLVPGAGEADDQQAEGQGPPPIPPAEVELTSKAGLFVNEQTGDLLRLAVDRGRFRVAGGPGLVHVADDRFRRWGASSQFMSGDAFELNFVSADQFELKSMEGKTTRYRRAQPFVPTPDDLKTFAGRYESDEIGATLAIDPSGRGEGLVMRLEHSPAQSLEFNPVDRDTFQFSRMTIRFYRDEAGKAVGFDFSNPVLRNVKFTRLSNG